MATWRRTKEPHATASPDGPPTITLERRRSFARLNLRELWDHKELIYFFVRRELKLKYSQTVVGVLWVLLEPLLLMALFALIFGLLLQISTNGIPRPVFYFSALVPWQYFSKALNGATGVVVTNRSVVTKVYFPRLVLPVSIVIPGIFDAIVAFVLLIGMLYLFGLSASLTLLYVPAFLAFAMLTALAVGLWLSSLNTRYRDVRRAISFITRVWFYASPVIYPATVVPEQWRALYFLNPMAGVIAGIRWAATGLGDPPSMSIFISVGLVILLLFGGIWYFRKTEAQMVDVV